MNNPRVAILATILTLASVGQIILAIFLYDPDGNAAVINLGWVILWISAIFGWLPISPHPREVRIVRWTARIISLLAAGAWLLIMLDILLCELVFGCITLTWETGLLVVLATVSVLSVISAWRWEGPGGVAMILWGLVFTLIAYVTSHPYEVFSVLVTGVPFLIAGGLFLASWWWSHKDAPQWLTNNHTV
jgi:hypothetical protein